MFIINFSDFMQALEIFNLPLFTLGLPLSLAGGLFVVYSVLIRTYKTQLEQERELRRLREEFVFLAAHELRTPVTGIKWMLETIAYDESFLQHMSKEQVEALRGIEARNKDLTLLIDDIMSIARVQHTPTVNLEEIDVVKLAEEARAVVDPVAYKQNVNVSWDILNQTFSPVIANPNHFKEIIENLGTNGAKYNRPGGWVKIYGEEKKEEVVITVEDNGIGLTDTEKKEMFQEFHRIKNKETKRISGTGLGLFIARQLVERMNGRIWVESEKNKGSKFMFSLPLAIKKVK
jgi:signal transduction histidine kinase